MAIKKASRAIGESKQRKMVTTCKRKARQTAAKLERARKRLRKKT